ncbi:MAG: hypothetical protein R3F61_02255 [Myxococcota bacterium]
MRPTEAMQLARTALGADPSELERKWLAMCSTLVEKAASRGAKETDIRFLVPPDVSSHDALLIGRRMAGALDLEGYSRPRCRLRDEFLQDGPAVVGDAVYPEGSVIVWIELSLDWDR